MVVPAADNTIHLFYSFIFKTFSSEWQGDIVKDRIAHLGMRALASSAVSGHRLAKQANSNLCIFFIFFLFNKLKRRRRRKISVLSAETEIHKMALKLGYHRPIRNMAAANKHKLNFINQRNEPHHKREHVKISNAAKFQSCWPKSHRMTDI